MQCSIQCTVKASFCFVFLFFWLTLDEQSSLTRSTCRENPLCMPVIACGSIKSNASFEYSVKKKTKQFDLGPHFHVYVQLTSTNVARGSFHNHDSFSLYKLPKYWILSWKKYCTIYKISTYKHAAANRNVVNFKYAFAPILYYFIYISKLMKARICLIVHVEI